MDTFYNENKKTKIKCYSLKITKEMKDKALEFAKSIVLSDNQFSRLLPSEVRYNEDIELQKKIEIQRTYMGKLGEIAFAELLKHYNKHFDCSEMFEIFPGQENYDSYDFLTVNGETVDIKTGFRENHSRLLVNLDQFTNNPKDFYVAVKLNAIDEDEHTLVDWDSVTRADILGYVEYNYMRDNCKIRNFGEGDAKYRDYNWLLQIDRLLNRF